MLPADFAFLAHLVHRRSGIVLTESRRALIEGRLAPAMHRFGFKDLGQVLHELRLGSEALAAAVTEMMTVHETSFFRDGEFFRRLGADILPALIRSRGAEKRLRIWSAACAAGQEPYSLAMMLDNMGLAAQGWTIDLIATDISTEAIARAERGRYNFFETERGLSEADLAVWFEADAIGHSVAGHIRRMVNFRRFNLLDSYGWLDDIDLVLCRNVLIYFDGATRASVLERIADVMAPEGVLGLGDAEAAPKNLFHLLPGGDGIYAKLKSAMPRLGAAV
jgi:chemotaxis protein methyltransferase CheR